MLDQFVKMWSTAYMMDFTACDLFPNLSSIYQ